MSEVSFIAIDEQLWPITHFVYGPSPRTSNQFLALSKETTVISSVRINAFEKFTRPRTFYFH